MTNNIYVLVTGVGAIIGQGIVKSLKERKNIIVVGLDKNPNTYGQYFCNKFISKPSYSEDSYEYIKFIKDIIKSYEIQLIVPGIESDMHFFNTYKKEFVQLHCKIVLNQTSLINLSSDKWIFHQFLQEISYPTIPTIESTTWKDAQKSLGDGPYILKPKCGNGSRGIYKIDDKVDFDYWINKVNDNYILQKLIGSDEEEYTVGTFGFNDGNILEPIILKRILSVEGNTKYAETVTNKIIKDAIYEISKYVKPIGPTNFQFRLENNIAYLLEINPRFSSSNSIRTAFGYNEALMSVDYYLFQKKDFKVNISEGKAWRYLEDFVI